MELISQSLSITSQNTWSSNFTITEK